MDNKLFRTYELRKNDYAKKLSKKSKQIESLVLFRPVSFLSAVGFFVYAYYMEKPVYLLFTGLLMVSFILLVFKHNKAKSAIMYLENMHYINKSALLRLSGNWTEFPNSGSRFIEPDHPYSKDLDIFGKGSLFQFINAAASFMGEERLAQLLSSGGAAPKEIYRRQQAVEELSPRLNWRQHFQAVGLEKAKNIQSPDNLLSWAEEKPMLINNRYVLLLRFLPVVTLSLALLGVFQLVFPYLWTLPLFIQIIVIAYTEGLAREAFSVTGKAAKQVQRYAALLSCIEQENFESSLTVDLQKKLLTGGQAPSQQIKSLSNIAERMNLRYSSFHIIVNIALLWDVHTLIKLEHWKNEAGRSLRIWLEVIGEFEALSSLAGLAHDHPDWSFPEVDESTPAFEAEDLGHPLIKDDLRVSNDAALPRPGTILIITGSNMSGKSTFLRTVGINLVLAYSGTVVCAKKLRCSIMDIYTSMQLIDNLEQNVSSFYAELKRMKLIVDAAKAEKPIIFLIDEIFRGTNSRDRISGAKAVIKSLSSLSTIGLVSTHDLELSILEKEIPLINNYHFTDKIRGKEINFDYRLKPGVSQSTNAIALMKIIGLEV